MLRQAQTLRIITSSKCPLRSQSTSSAPLSEHLQSFSRAKTGSFQQDPPVLGNQFLEDVTLQKYLKQHVSQDSYRSMHADLSRFGARCGGELAERARECETSPPTLRTFDAWGRRVDEINTCAAWKHMKRVSAEEGLIASAYDGSYGEHSRLYQVVKLYLFVPSSGMYGCPLAMTDGAAKTFWNAAHSPGSTNPHTQEVVSAAYKSLTSRDPGQFWTSGQWMTEKAGGSDVGAGTSTLAIPSNDGGATFRLHGYKWFTSATDSDMALTLGRDADAHGLPLPGAGGGRGLSMYFLKVREDDGRLNNMQIMRLKDKLGTRQLPTAELLLDGTEAHRVSEPGKGISSISSMLQITRLHNVIASAAGMRRMVNLARDYSHRRSAFGASIKDFPLHMKALTWMEIESRSALLLTLDMAQLLGAEEDSQRRGGQRSEVEEERSLVFRLLSPVAKLYTAKQAVAVASEGLECFGGAGYLEDTGLPSMLRDAQVLPIWEGTTSVLSLDVLRAISRSHGACLSALHAHVCRRLGTPAQLPAAVAGSGGAVAAAAQEMLVFVAENVECLEEAARDLAYSIARVYMGMLLVEHAVHTGEATDAFAANRWCEQDLLPMVTKHRHGNYAAGTGCTEQQLVFAGYPSKL